MSVDRKRLRELALAATPGPWTEDAFDWGDGSKEPTGWINARDKAVVEYAGCGSHGASWNDSDLAFVLAANPQTILALLDALEAAEQQPTDNARLLTTAEQGEAK